MSLYLLVDTTPPSISLCPSDIIKNVEIGVVNVSVNWTQPVATDLSENVTLLNQSHRPGENFTIGRTTVAYRFVDGSNNEAACIFEVLVNQGN